MILKKKKISARRQHVRNNISAGRFARISRLANSTLPVAIRLLVIFIVLTIMLLGVDTSRDQFWKPDSDTFRPYSELLALSAIVILVCLGAALYVRHYQRNIMSNPTRIIALAGLFLVLLTLTRVGSLYPE